MSMLAARHDDDDDVLADHRVKLKESKKKDNYLDISRELKNCGT